MNRSDLKNNKQFSEEFLLNEIEKGLSSIDKSEGVYTPTTEWFENFIRVEQQKIKKKLFLDITLFTIIAMFILSGVLFSLYNIPIIFITVQGLTALFLISFVCLESIRQKRGVWKHE